MSYQCCSENYESNKSYSSSSDSKSSLYVVNNSKRGACRGTCIAMGVCTCGK